MAIGSAPDGTSPMARGVSHVRHTRAMQPDRRRLLKTALAAGMAPAFARHARAADASRFALGVASGQPRRDGMVLWTRLTGDELPARVDVRWEMADDEGFTRI